MNFKGQEEGIIKIIGNFNIDKNEVCERIVEYNSKKEKYKVILMPLIKS